MDVVSQLNGFNAQQRSFLKLLYCSSMHTSRFGSRIDFVFMRVMPSGMSALERVKISSRLGNNDC